VLALLGLVGRRLVSKESDEVGKLAVSFVVFSRFVILGVPLEGRVATDGETINFVHGGVELGNDKVVNVSDRLGKLIPNRGEFLAVTAPRSVVLNEDILTRVHDDVSPVVTDEHGERARVLGNRLTLQVGLDLANLDIVNEFVDRFAGHVLKRLGVGELTHFFSGVEHADSRHSRRVHTNKLSKSLLDAISGATLHEQSFTLEFGSNLREFGVKGRVLVVGEEDKSRAAFAENRLNVILREVNQGRNGRGFAERRNSFLGVVTLEVDRGFVERAEN